MAYKTIDGNKYEAELLDLAEQHTTGQGEGKIAKDEAKEIIESAKDGQGATQIEKDTLTYIRKKYPFTEAAAKYFDDEMSKL